jgi:hypothetical protein
VRAAAQGHAFSFLQCCITSFRKVSASSSFIAFLLIILTAYLPGLPSFFVPTLTLANLLCRDKWR